MTEEKTDVIVVGELNLDIIFDGISAFPELGKEVLANQMTVTLGSSSAIFASNVSTLGAKTAFLGKLGKDRLGEFVIEALESRNVDTHLIEISDQLVTGVSIVLSCGNERANISHLGAMAYLRLEDIDDSALSKARHLHLSNCFMQPMLKNEVGHLFRKAKEMGLTTSFDPQWDPYEKWDLDLKAVLPYVDLFLPNEAEALHLTRTGQVGQAIADLADMGHAVVVKRGSRGSILGYGKRTIEQKPFLHPQVKDTIGAGDSFDAGFVYRYINNAPLEKCQEFANLIGAVNTTASGGTAAFENREAVIRISRKLFGCSIKLG